MEGFPNANNTRFYDQITKLFRAREGKISDLQKQIDESGWKGRVPQQTQWLCYDYVVNGGNRGLILYHDMGSGKTFTSIIMAEALGMNTIIISPIGTQLTFFIEIAVYKKLIRKDEDLGKIDPMRMKKIRKEIERTYTFVPMKSINMVAIFEKSTKSVDMNFKYNSGPIGELDNTFIVIDEAHDFAVSVKNGSKHARTIFEKIINSDNARIVCLTGTPIVNTSYEFALLAIMVRGPMRVGKSVMYAFPSDSEQYFKMFFDPQKRQMINKKKFQERIAGLVSYVGVSDQVTKDMPTKKDMVVVHVEMADQQWKEYTTFRMREKELERIVKKDKKGHGGGAFSVKKSAYGGNFRAWTRQICNYSLPSYVDRNAKDPFAQIKDEDLSTNLANFSPKAVELIKLLNASKDMVTIVYSDFTHAGGIQSFVRALELHGYANIDKEQKPFMTFAVWTSETNDFKRKFITNIEWSPDNVRGKLLRVIFLSRVGSQGLNFKYVRQVVLLEPFWNMARIVQTIARGTRMGSHALLPEKERTVTPYIMLAKMPIKSFDGEDKTTDEFIYDSAMRETEENEPFLEAIRETSIHCALTDKRRNCFSCAASSKDAPLFDPNPLIHFHAVDECK